MILEISTAVRRSTGEEQPVSLAMTRLGEDIRRDHEVYTLQLVHSALAAAEPAMDPGPALLRSVFIDYGLCKVAGSILHGKAHFQVPCVFKPMRV